MRNIDKKTLNDLAMLERRGSKKTLDNEEEYGISYFTPKYIKWSSKRNINTLIKIKKIMAFLIIKFKL